MRFCYGAAFLATFFAFSVTAQQTFLPCGTSQVVKTAIWNNPSLLINMEELEQFTDSFDGNGAERSVTKIIPIVFHVIHTYGSENISKAQIADAVRILNQDFKLLNPDQDEIVPAFADIKGNCDFEFRLARKDPAGNCTDGITRAVSPLTFSANDNVKQLISWPRNKYLNVWVVEQIVLSELGGVVGYAYLPGSSPSATVDGIIISNRVLGSIGTSDGSNFASRALTHEIGHWFNLRHTWGDTNQPGVASNCNGTDGVSDTPPTIGVANQSCNLSQSTCGVLDNVQNYMDYSSCAQMFTTRQTVRMQAAAASAVSGRNNLWSADNLTATGVNLASSVCAPIADFLSTMSQSCTNTNVQFTDLSYNADVTGSWNWNWTFEGGNPSTSTLQNPVVTYAVPGAYQVQLTVSNATGSSSKTKTGYELVSYAISDIYSPVLQGFENANFPAISPLFSQAWRYEGQEGAFSRTTTASVSGVASLKYTNSQIGAGLTSSFISPAVNYANILSPASLKFKVAYTQRSSSTLDRLEVWISINCGRTWTRRYSKTGATLATAPATTQPFVPAADQWREESVNVTPFIGEPSGLVKFTVIDGSGNNIYIEDINLVVAPLGIDDPSLDESLTAIFPNPGTGDAQISFSLVKAEKTTISVLDIAGRVIGTKQLGMVTPGEHQLNISQVAGTELNAGLYVVRIEAGNSVVIRKWICN